MQCIQGCIYLGLHEVIFSTTFTDTNKGTNKLLYQTMVDKTNQKEICTVRGNYTTVS